MRVHIIIFKSPSASRSDSNSFFYVFLYVLNSHFFLHLTHSIVWWERLRSRVYSKTERERDEEKKKVLLALLSLQHQYYTSFFCYWGNFWMHISCSILWKLNGRRKKLETHVHSFVFTLSANSIINCWVKWHSCATICLSTHSSCRKLHRVACHHHHVRNERGENENGVI